MSTSTIKLNNSTEVIALGVVPPVSSAKRDRYKNAYRQSDSGHGHSRYNQNVSRIKPQQSPYFSDPLIVPRVRQYLEDHSQDDRIDFEDMVDTLQVKYRDYSQRKRSAFKGLVDRAYASVLHKFSKAVRGPDGGDNEGCSSENSEEDGEGADDDIPETHPANRVNVQLMSLYASGNQKRNLHKKTPGQEELINISSSEDEDGENAKKKNRTSLPDEASITPIIISTLMPNGANVSVTSIPKQLTVNLNTPTIDRSRTKKVIEFSKPTKTPASAKKKREVASTVPEITFADFGGNTKMLEEVCQLLVHIRHPEVYRQIGVTPPRGFLLHGPPGCGKTLLAQAIAGEMEVPLIKVASPELVAGVSGESEQRIRELFQQAVDAAPCVLFLDEVDAITPNRHTAQREMERRIVAQLLTCLDDLNQKEGGDQVLVIGATNRPDALDPALRRAGRFDREVYLGIPDLRSRVQILKVLCARLRLAPGVQLEDIAANAPGFVGADLMALTREAAMAAVNRVFGDLKASRSTTTADTANTEESGQEVVQDEEDVQLAEEEEKSQELSEKSEVNEEKKVDDADEEKNCEEKETAEGNDLPEESPAKDAADEEAMKMDVCEDAPPPADLPPPPAVLVPPPAAPAPPPVEPVATAPRLQDLMAWLHDAAPLTAAQLDSLHVEMSDFELALKRVQPSAKREGFATVPDVTWDDVGSLQDIRDELQMAILAPVRHPAQFASLGVSTAAGVLLCGPPGCGKTLLAKAVANEAGVNFISVKGPELLNMYVGESERAVRQCFQRARNSAPCVIFFDELDALCPKRSDSSEGGASMRVVNQMLTEMDGIEGRKGVFLMAATNRPDIVDPAVMRPGRLDKILYVGLPTAGDRVDILQALTKSGTRPTLAGDVDLALIGAAAECDGYSGADLAALVREAGIEALRDFLASGATSQHLVVADAHFKRALAKIRPSVSQKDQKYYEKLREIYTAVPKH